MAILANPGSTLKGHSRPRAACVFGCGYLKVCITARLFPFSSPSHRCWSQEYSLINHLHGESHLQSLIPWKLKMQGSLLLLHPAWDIYSLSLFLSWRFTFVHEVGIYKKRSYNTHLEESLVGELGDIGEKKAFNEPKKVEYRDLISNLILKEVVLK